MSDEIVKAARALLEKIDLVDESDSIKAVFMSAYIHGVKYDGPTYASEREELRAALVNE